MAAGCLELARALARVLSGPFGSCGSFEVLGVFGVLELRWQLGPGKAVDKIWDSFGRLSVEAHVAGSRAKLKCVTRW